MIRRNISRGMGYGFGRGSAGVGVKVGPEIVGLGDALRRHFPVRG